MPPLDRTDPAQFIADFYTAFNRDILDGDEAAALIVDRYHTPDIVQVADGNRIDRDKLIDHIRPVRKNRPSSRMEVHEAAADGDRLAARYTLHAAQRGKDLAIEVYFFGAFAPDGRMRSAHMLTRAVPAGTE
ncbi:nuclear transport factor 2 family protein [Glycomyces sp. A-F 0318]|uniref:nuclear transport factor 2 family protein n=1 Tax=Glycomyces amatae TaxID=2881355 RepID=UPI001E5D7A14|nr:nuclear transport factor 2 family protein [Glycomyces amatae]MCD0442510.1 nuclear transport factor 2 family protein [Glycomyces amatae]